MTKYLWDRTRTVSRLLIASGRDAGIPVGEVWCRRGVWRWLPWPQCQDRPTGHAHASRDAAERALRKAVKRPALAGEGGT